MKTHMNWCKHLGLCLVALTLVFVAASCGGGTSGVTNVAPENNAVTNAPVIDQRGPVTAARPAPDRRGACCIVLMRASVDSAPWLRFGPVGVSPS